jgi:hypothetical protein
MEFDGHLTRPPITVIVVTRMRPSLLERAIRSLARQQGVQLELIVIIDDCQATASYITSTSLTNGAIETARWFYADRTAAERSGPRRLAGLRERGLVLTETRWCAFFDDDNELEPTHYSSLLECITAHRSPAAHSWRTMWTRDGRPFPLVDRHPWCRDRGEAQRLFEQYRSAGIYRPHSSVVQDQVIPNRRDHSMVDTSEWLFATEFIRAIGFEHDYSQADWLRSRCEDSKLLDEIVRRGTTVPATGRATLRYYLGGYSNTWSEEAAQIEGWVVGRDSGNFVWMVSTGALISRELTCASGENV